MADGCDLAVRLGDPASGTFVARKLVETRILAVASPSYIAANGKPEHPIELSIHVHRFL